MFMETKKISTTKNSIDDPLTLRCRAVLPNRIALAPLTNTQSNLDGTLHENELKWLVRRAGNFGLLSTCATFVSEEGHAWKGQLGIADDKHLPGLTKLAKALTEAGSKPIVQLHHGGSKADQAPQKISSSASEGVLSATKDDIARITEDFVQAALRAEQAGFAGVEVHGANGYIFTQFLGTELNHRDDEYGGDIQGRAKFLRETVQAIRKKVSSSFIVNVRISPVDYYIKRGLYLKDSLQVVKWMVKDGVDVIHLSLRDAKGPGPYETNKTPVVSAIHSVIPESVKLASAGGIWTRQDAQETVNAGADIVVLGKAAIIHPEWPSQSLSPNFEPNMPPWNEDSLKQVDVSPNFINYLRYAHNLLPV